MGKTKNIFMIKIQQMIRLFKMWLNTPTLGSETNMFAKQTPFDTPLLCGGVVNCYIGSPIKNWGCHMFGKIDVHFKF